ncbi:hypothetical protein EIN_289530 [Entamoeba invadens IP1]|uniref:Leucine rich repeat containing protein BspA family protein n=2 Tax=Entamoeba invadens IP1 TaxID=370355 RepID=L7FL47_ENTIV|nr:hypothetical protein EIN_289530 [Entamoeba invadens IP1]ELP86681.1 hypothetical protein EIN_289530 [Entamoeba invadens IP1]|eukprot:XP_004186027.1 hypothetical protein EIN_289530 [Entamoeba invadens IP1]
MNNFNVCPLSVYTKEDQIYFKNKIPHFVRKISEQSFEGSQVVSIKLPPSVIEIGNFAFSDCSHLSSIELPSNLMRLGINTFYGCSRLKEIRLPKLVEVIPESCFSNCSSLTSVDFGPNVTLICRNAFSGCAFNDFTAEKNVYIDELVFVHNTLTKITFCGKKCIPQKTCRSCQNLEEVVMDNTVEIIADSAFSECTSLKRITLSSNLEMICKCAFSNCNKLSEFEVPQKVRFVGSFAFKNCEQLVGLNFNENVVFEDGGCFEQCISLAKLDVPINYMKHLYNATESEQQLFKKLGIDVSNMMKKEEVNENVFKLDNYNEINNEIRVNSDYIHLGDLDVFKIKFNYTSDHLRLYIPSTVVNFRIKVFDYGNPIEKIIIPENAFLINESKFCIKNAKCVQLPDTITFIPDDYFSSSELEEFVVPRNVREIGKNAFVISNNLTSLYIPKSVTKIGKNFVGGCSNLKSIVFEDGHNVDINKETENQDIIHCVTAGIKKLNYNFEFPFETTKIEVPSSVTKISGLYFYKYKNLCEVVFPPTIKIFERVYFYNCHKLTKISFTECKNTLNNLENNKNDINTFKTFFFDNVIVDYKFYLQMYALGYTFHNVDYTQQNLYEFGDKVDWSVIKSVNFENKNVSMKNTHYWKTQFDLYDTFTEKFEMPLQIKTLEYCKLASYNLREVDVSLVSKKINKLCFNNMHFLQKVTFSNTLEEIDEKVFFNCFSLKSVTLPQSLKKFGKRCFANCYSLESVFCESKEVLYKTQCFMNCFNLKFISKVKHLKGGVFWCCNSLIKFDNFRDIECIPHCMFMKCYNLKEMVFPTTLKTIGKFAFKNCYSLESLTFPKSLENVEDGCFMNCSNLKRVNFKNNKITFGSDVFEGCASLSLILFNEEKTTYYSGEVSYTLYKQFEQKQMICDNVKVKFNDLKMFGIDILKDEKVHRIDEGAFFNNTTITEIEIPNNITKIGDFCFACATQLENVILPLSITELSPFCFDNCVSLETINLENITKIGMGCFDNTKFEKIL